MRVCGTGQSRAQRSQQLVATVQPRMIRATCHQNPLPRASCQGPWSVGFPQSTQHLGTHATILTVPASVAASECSEPHATLVSRSPCSSGHSGSSSSGNSNSHSCVRRTGGHRNHHCRRPPHCAITRSATPQDMPFSALWQRNAFPVPHTTRLLRPAAFSLRRAARSLWPQACSLQPSSPPPAPAAP